MLLWKIDIIDEKGLNHTVIMEAETINEVAEIFKTACPDVNIIGIKQTKHRQPRRLLRELMASEEF